MAAAAVPAALGQSWEVGGGAGAGFFLPKDVERPAETANFRIQPGVAVSGWLSNNTSDHWGGEIRYTYQSGQLQLKQGPAKATFDSERHTLHYDFQWHATQRDATARPYIAFGAGVRVYRGTGTEQLTQPLSRFLLLTRTQELQGLLSTGVGVKTKLSQHWQFRVDVHNYMTRFPKEVAAPNLGAKVGGWVFDLVPMAGLTWTR
jgi:outer membrane protein W